MPWWQRKDESVSDSPRSHTDDDASKFRVAEKRVHVAEKGLHEVDKLRGSPASNHPLFAFALMLFHHGLLPTAMSSDVVLVVLYVAYGVIITIFFIVFTAGRGILWRLYSLLCLALTAAGLMLGLLVRNKYPTEVRDNGIDINVTAVTNCAFISLAFLATAALIEATGCNFVGAVERMTGAVAKRGLEHWNPGMEATMSYTMQGVNSKAIVAQDRHHHPRYVERCLLHNRHHWCGEPVLDYFYFLSNEHGFISCFFCHPLHPYDKLERCLVLMITVSLIVFPVSVFSVCFEHDALRPVWVLFVITGPRNALRWYVKRVNTVDDRLALDRPDLSADERNRLVQRAYVWGLASNIVVINLCGAICWACCYYIVQSGHVLWLTLLANSNGIMWAHIMDLHLNLLLPRKAADIQASEQGVPFTFGFFGRWAQERDIIADGHDLRYCQHPLDSGVEAGIQEAVPLLRGRAHAAGA